MDTAEVIVEPKKERPQNRHLKPRTGTVNNKTATALELAIERNLPADMAYQLAHQNVPHRSTLHRFKKKVEHWRIESPKAQKVAHKTLREFAAGKPVGGISPNPSAILDAAKRVIDQVTPVVKQTQSVNVNLNIDPVTLGDYLVD